MSYGEVVDIERFERERLERKKERERVMRMREENRKSLRMEDFRNQNRMEEERKKKAEAERKRRAEAERKRRTDAERERKAEAERKKKAEAERNRKAKEEWKKRKKEEERKRKAEIKRRREKTEEEERKKKKEEEDRRRREKEDKKRREEMEKARKKRENENEKKRKEELSVLLQESGILQKVEDLTRKNDTFTSKISTLEREVANLRKLEVEYENMKEEMKVLKISHDECQKKNEDQIREVKKKHDSEIEGLRREYESHFDKFHRTKYSFKSSITPQMFKKSDQVNYCFENDTFRFRFDFSVQSGPGTSEQNTSINFEQLKIVMNGEDFTRYNIMNNIVQLEETFTKIGRNELTCQFHDVVTTFEIDVEPSSLCTEKCDLLFYRADIEPSGDLTPSKQPTDKFSSGDIIQIVIKLVNENGVPLLPKFFEEEELDVKLFMTSGKRRRVKGVFSRDREVTIDEVDEKGEFCVCSIGEDKLVEKGTYEVKVDGDKIEVRKDFKIE